MRTIEVPGARRNDPPTSHEAYEDYRDSGRLTDSQKVVLDAIIKHGQGGILSDELAQAADMDRHEVARRLSELRVAGYVFVRGYGLSPERRKSRVGGRSGMVFRPIECQRELPV